MAYVSSRSGYRFKVKNAPSSSEVMKLWAGLKLEFKIGEIRERDFILLMLFIWYGRRMNEILTLTTEDIQFNKGSYGAIFFKQLKTKERETPDEALPLWPQVRQYLKNYITALVLLNRKRLFTITDRQARNIVYKYSKKYFGRRVRPHDFRHAVAQYILERYRDIELVSRVLGHTDIRTTQIYARHDFSTLERIKLWKENLEE